MEKIWKVSLIIFALIFLIQIPIVMAMLEITNPINLKKGEKLIFDGKEIPYNNLWDKYKPIQIKDNWGLPLISSIKAEAYISQHTETCGIECSSTIEIKLYEKAPLIQDVRFYTIDNGKRILQEIRSYQFYIKTNEEEISVDDYEWQCNPTGKININGTAETKCENKLVGTHIEKKPLWEIYNIGQEVPAGTYEIKLEGNKRPDRTVDWQIKTNGVWTSDWAIWGTNPITNNITAYYNFDEGIGNLAVDNVTRLWNLTSLGGLWGTGKIGGASASFNGLTNHYFNISNTNAFITTTIAGWINLSSGANNGGIFDLGVGSSTMWLGTGKLRCMFKNSTESENSAAVESISQIDTGNWVYIACVYNGTHVNTYVNGVQEASTVLTGTLKQNVNFLFGSNNAESFPLNGNLDEFGIWNRSLFADEIQTLYNSGSGFSYPFTQGSVTLNSPANAYISTTNLVNFNCSATISGGATLTNMSLWDNSTGIFKLNQTLTKTGTTNTSIFTNTYSNGQSIKWTCQACDSDGDCGFASENRTVNIDTSAPSINIVKPATTEDIGYYNVNQNLSWIITDTNFASAWYNYNGTNITVYGATNSTTFQLDGTDRNLTFWANDTAGNVNSTIITWTYTIFINSQTYNTTAYETSSETFSTNVTGATSANLVYDSISYTAIQSGIVWSRTIQIPTITAPTNKTFFWNFQSGINTTTYNQSVLHANLSICSGSGGSTSFLNFSFIDETAGTAINVSTDLADFDYWLGDGIVTKSYIFTNTTNNLNYNFCALPNTTFTVDLQYKYSKTGYPQRTFAYDNQALTNVTTHKTLYLLPSTDGIYSSIQVTSSVGAPISGVLIQIEREIGGVMTLIGQGTTGSDGVATFWVNPNYIHKITATKSGYTSVQVSITPSLSTYTITMSTTGGVGDFNSSIEGLRWLVYPGSGTLKPQTNQKFNATIYGTTGLAAIENCKFELLNASNLSQVFDSSTGFTNSTYCYLSITYTTSNNQKIFGRLSVDTDKTTGFVIVDSDWKWILIDIDVKGWRTLTSLFDDLTDLSEFGEGNEAEFNRIVLFFLIMTILVGVFMFFSGIELTSPGGTLIIIWGIVAIASVGGFLAFDSGIDSITPFFEQYGFFIILTTLLIGFALNLFRKTMD